MLLDFNGTLIIVAISFLIFMAMMQKIFYGPMGRIRRERKKYIEKNAELAKEYADKSVNLSNEFSEKIQNTKKEASKLIAEKNEKANTKKTEKLSSLKKQMNHKVDTQKSIINKDKNSAIEELKPQVAEFAQQISSKILGEDVAIAISPEVIDEAMKR